MKRWAVVAALWVMAVGCGREEPAQSAGWRIDGTLEQAFRDLEGRSGERFEISPNLKAERVSGVIVETAPLAQAHALTKLHGKCKLVFDPSEDHVLVEPSPPVRHVCSRPPYFFVLATVDRKAMNVVVVWESRRRPVLVSEGLEVNVDGKEVSALPTSWTRVLGTSDKARSFVVTVPDNAKQIQGKVHVVEAASAIELRARIGQTTAVGDFEIEAIRSPEGGTVAVRVRGRFAGPDFDLLPPHNRFYSCTIDSSPARIARAMGGSEEAVLELTSTQDPKEITLHYVKDVVRRSIEFYFEDALR